MAIKKATEKSFELVKNIVLGIEEKKGEDITCIDLRDVKQAVCDYFVICTGNSDRQIDSISDSIIEEVRKKSKEKPSHVEGKDNLEWVLIDYFDVIVHVFSQEAREFYQIENLWADGKEVEVN